MSLHLVFSTAGWQACRGLIKPDDGVVLLGDGAYLARQSFENVKAYVLLEDLEVRGFLERTSVPGITYTQFVELTTQYSPIVSWSK